MSIIGLRTADGLDGVHPDIVRRKHIGVYPYQADDTALRDIEEALRITERSGEDIALSA